MAFYRKFTLLLDSKCIRNWEVFLYGRIILFGFLDAAPVFSRLGGQFGLSNSLSPYREYRCRNISRGFEPDGNLAGFCMAAGVDCGIDLYWSNDLEIGLAAIGDLRWIICGSQSIC